MKLLKQQKHLQESFKQFKLNKKLVPLVIAHIFRADKLLKIT